MHAAASSETPDGIAGWAVSLMETLGAPGAGLAVALENLFPPLPSEVILPLAGFAASRGSIGLVDAIVWTTLGSLMGALALYGLGALLGHDRLRRIADRMPLVTAADLDRTDEWFRRHGNAAVFFGRMVPVFRSFISIPAGVERMHLALFAALTTAGSLVWNSVFVLAGYLLGEQWHIVEQYTGVFSRIVLALIVLGLAWFVVTRVRRVRARRREEADSGVSRPATAAED